VLTAAAVNWTPGGVTIGDVRPLFALHARPVVRLDGYPYDVSGDGQRFLVNLVSDTRTTEPLALLVNWTGALPR